MIALCLCCRRDSKALALPLSKRWPAAKRSSEQPWMAFSKLSTTGATAFSSSLAMFLRWLQPFVCSSATLRFATDSARPRELASRIIFSAAEWVRATHMHFRRSSPMAYDAAAVVGEVVVEPGAAMRVLDRTLLRGVTWTGGIKGLTLLLSWASTIVVARILSPADYGLVAMATVYLGLTTMITDFGLGSAIVALRHPGERRAAQLPNVVAVTCID